MNGSQLVYHAEGAANIIYTFAPSTGTIEVNGTSLDTSKYVLRLRKDLPHVSAAGKTVAEFERCIKPLFEQRYLLEQMPVPLSVELSSDLNKRLRESESGVQVLPRDVKRRGVYLPCFEDEQYGIVMPKLSASAPDGCVFEFKPKWLVQSPSAPLNSRRCRTCALRDMRDAKGHLHGRGSGSFCPLDLVSDETVVNKDNMVRSLWPAAHVETDMFFSEFMDKVGPLLTHLCNVQQKYDRVSLDDFETGHPDLPLAMALRDCSVFVQWSDLSPAGAKGPGGTNMKIRDVKLADLDLKSTGGGKLERWIEVERELIQGAWYLGQPLDSDERPTCRIDRSMSRT